VEVGCGDKGLAGGAEYEFSRGGGDGGEERGEVIVGELACEAVGCEKVEVAGKRGMSLDLGIDVRMGADGAGDEVAKRRAGCLFGGYLASAELVFDDGVVGGEKRKPAAAEAITAAVAYVGEPEFARLGGIGLFIQRGVEESDEGGAHPGELRVLACVLEDGLVRGVDCGGEGGLRVLGWGLRGGVDEMLEKGVGGKTAGYFSAGGSAHAVADDKDAGGG
jgi:hypothetical protein